MVGVRTDFRGGEDQGLNLMLSNTCCDLIAEASSTTTLTCLADRIVKALTTGTTPFPERTGLGSLL